MAPKGIFTAILCTTLLAFSHPSVADEYRPSEFLGLDLSKAVLSPKRLGPETQFAPVPVEAKSDRSGEREAARAEPVAHPKIAVRKNRAAQARAGKPRGAARTKLARRHGNPLDAQAFDTRVQTWPCKSGGICNWKQ